MNTYLNTRAHSKHKFQILLLGSGQHLILPHFSWVFIKVMAMIETKKYRKEYFPTCIEHKHSSERQFGINLFLERMYCTSILKSNVTLFHISFSLSSSIKPLLRVLTLESVSRVLLLMPF